MTQPAIFIYLRLVLCVGKLSPTQFLDSADDLIDYDMLYHDVPGQCVGLLLRAGCNVLLSIPITKKQNRSLGLMPRVSLLVEHGFVSELYK